MVDIVLKHSPGVRAWRMSRPRDEIGRQEVYKGGGSEGNQKKEIEERIERIIKN